MLALAHLLQVALRIRDDFAVLRRSLFKPAYDHCRFERDYFCKLVLAEFAFEADSYRIVYVEVLTAIKQHVAIERSRKPIE